MISTSSTLSISVAEIAGLSRDIASLNAEYLGIAVTILALLGTGFYIFSFKPVKEAIDKQAEEARRREEEREGHYNAVVGDVEKKIEALERSLSDSTALALEKNGDAMMLKTDNRVAAFENDFSKRMDQVAEGKDMKLRELVMSETRNMVQSASDVLKKELTESKIAVDQHLATLRKMDMTLVDSLKRFERRIKELEVYKWSKEGRMGAVFGRIEMLKEAIDDPIEDWRIPTRLEELEKEITGFVFNVDVITKIEEQLVRLDTKKQYAPLVERVRKCITPKTE